MAKPFERMSSRACALLALRSFPREPARNADVFSGGPADPARPDPELHPGPARTRASDRATRPRHDRSGVGARLSVGHRLARLARDTDRGMTAPTPSQTVGPFFGFALPFANDAKAPAGESPDAIRVEGQVLDGTGDPVGDALIEASQGDQFARCRTDGEGAFHFTVRQPVVSKCAQYLNTKELARCHLLQLHPLMHIHD